MSGDHSEQGSESTHRLGSFLWGTSWEHRKRQLRTEAWILVVGVYVLISFTYTWPSDFRNQSPVYVAMAWSAALVRTFLFHIGLILAVVALAATRARMWRLVTATIPLLVVTLGPSLATYWPWSRDTVIGEAPIVMSVNLLMTNRHTTPIVNEIEAVRPDILLLQEYTAHWHEALQAKIKDDYPYISYITRDDSFGAAIYSRRPFMEEPERFVSIGQEFVPQMRAVFEISGRKIAIYNIHLLPPTGMEYTIENRTQFADLLNVLAAESLPTIVGGDFNFTENSLNASALSQLGFADAHSVGGWGRGATWPVTSIYRWLPGIRLDHIYLGGGLTCADCRIGIGKGSDHRPVIAKIGFRQ